MKKITLIIFALLFCSIFSMQSQVRLITLDEQKDIVTIKNFGSTTVDISNWWFCALFQYAQLKNLTTESGSLQLTPNSSVSLSGFAITDAASDFGLYATNLFSIASEIRDFTQWGAAGLGREGVAVAAGIWTAGNFLPAPGPYQYTGNGTQNGVNFWQKVLSINNFDISNSLQIYPNPTKEVVKISNSSDELVSKFELFNTLGVQILQLSQVENNELKLSNIASGNYIIKLYTKNNNVVYKKIIVE